MAESSPSTDTPVLDPSIVALEPEPYIPQTEEELKKFLQIQVADVSNVVRDEAADSADEHLRRQTTEHGVKGFVKKIWYGNIARDFVRQRDLRRKERSIVAEQNAYLHSGGTQADHDRAMGAVIQRVTSDYSLLHAGETNAEASSVNGGQGLEDSLKQVINSFVNGSIDDRALGEEKARLLTVFGAGQRSADRRKGLIYADNVIEVARNARAAFEHGVALDRIDQALGLKVADVKVGVRTAASNELADRIIDKAYSTSVGSLVNETVLATAVAVGIGTSKFTVRKIASALGATLGIGVGAAGVAAVRESHHVKQERRLHSRQMAEGGIINDADSKRRQKLEATRYETVDAIDLIDRLNHHLDIADADETPATLADLIAATTEARLRVEISDQEGVDLIRYSGKLDVEQQRLDLDIAIARAQVKLLQRDPDHQPQALTDAGVDATWIDQAINSGQDQVRDQLDADMNQKDAQFSRLRRQRMLASAAIGLVVGTTIGEATQELRSTFDDSLKGLFSHNSASQNRVSELAALFNHGDKTTVQRHMDTVLASKVDGVYHVGHNAIELPAGYHIAAEGTHGGADLVGPGGKVVADHLEINKDGELSAASVKLLDEKGFKLETSHSPYTTTRSVSREVTVDSKDYIAAHPNEFTEVHREIWYDNDTPYPDKNELETWWGGENYTGIDAQGNFILNVSHMTPGGSYEGSQSVDYAQLLASGKLGLAVSLTQSDQSHVIMLHFNADGNVIIPKDNPALSSVFINNGGHAEFIGAYAEVVQIGDKGPDGTAMSMLGTLVGTNQPRVMHETVHSLVHSTVNRNITHIEAPVEKPYFVESTSTLPIEVAPVIPVTPRKGMEALKSPPRGDGYYYYSYGAGNEFYGSWVEQRSPRLKRSPDADLVPGVEIPWYIDQQKRERGKAYVDEVNGYVEANEALKQIDASTKAVVCIPVAAASESENIYRTLSLFGQQDEASKQASVILLNVNWPDAMSSDPVKMAAIQKTLNEIDRARADFPDLKIAVFEKRWSEEFIKSKQRVVNGKKQSGIYGSVVKVLYDTAAFAMARAISEGRRGQSDDSIIITNDADTMGLSRNYLKRYIQVMAEHPEVDTFAGSIRRGTEAYRDYPGYGVVSNFYTYLNIMNSRRSSNSITEGPNSAIRTATYAAMGGMEDGMGAGADALLSSKLWIVRSSRSTPRGFGRLRRQQPIANRRLGQYVTGAQVDTIPDRLLGAYKKGQWIARGWDGFDNGDGYEDRSVVMGDTQLSEDPATDMDAIARRIEVSVEGFASNWYRDPATVSGALSLAFGVWKADNPLYDYHWDLSKEGDGAFTFKFTEEGKRVLRNNLMRDQSGRFDPLGNRLERQLYNRARAGAAKQPSLTQARMVS